MDLLLDPITHDLVFSNTAPTATPTVTDDLAQRLKIKLLTFFGEWFLDTTIGVDYFGQVFGKNRSLETIDALIQSQILAEQDVKKLSSYTSTLYGDRGLSIVFEVQDATGQTTQPITVSVGV